MHFIKFSINQHRFNILFSKFKGPVIMTVFSLLFVGEKKFLYNMPGLKVVFERGMWDHTCFKYKFCFPDRASSLLHDLS